MDITGLYPILVPLGISIVGGTIGAFYAKTRGLPGVRSEIAAATKELIMTLKTRLELAENDLILERSALVSAKGRIELLELDVERLERRIISLYARLEKLGDTKP